MRCVMLTYGLNVIYRINILTEENIKLYIKNIFHQDCESCDLIQDININDFDTYVKISDFVDVYTGSIHITSFLNDSFVENVLEVLKKKTVINYNYYTYNLHLNKIQENYKKYVAENLIKSIIE